MKIHLVYLCFLGRSQNRFRGKLWYGIPTAFSKKTAKLEQGWTEHTTYAFYFSHTCNGKRHPSGKRVWVSRSLILVLPKRLTTSITHARTQELRYLLATDQTSQALVNRDLKIKIKIEIKIKRD
jgi:hypothetical protein